MKDTLLIDLGNTNMSLAVKSRDNLIDLKKINSKDLNSLKIYLSDKNISGAVILSVVPTIEKDIEVLLKDLYKDVEIDIVGNNLSIPMDSTYSKESILGQDRLLNAYFVKEKIGFPAVVIDVGSAITIDLISSKGKFKGGVIFPGFKALAKALKDRAELLPEVGFDSIPQGLYGDSTESSVKIGIFTAVSSLVSRVIDNYRNIENIDISIVLTGGDAPLLINSSNIDFIYLPTLTIDALGLLSS